MPIDTAPARPTSEVPAGEAAGIVQLLRFVFGLVPIVAGADKFFDFLTAWPRYVAPAFAKLLPMSPGAFMHVVGIIEIVVGIGVLIPAATRLFAWIACLWLVCISLNLVAAGFYDIAVRDLVMAVTAGCLARMTAWVPEMRGARRGYVPLRESRI